jgi:hypothetical protein
VNAAAGKQREPPAPWNASRANFSSQFIVKFGHKWWTAYVPASNATTGWAPAKLAAVAMVKRRRSWSMDRHALNVKLATGLSA